ncbi:hypothetical protein roselon_01469 [Roseibacterium elongatum DSM 19469]|uniref:Uncharacterized protein n=1 Tax=Roseicyclus elongatus DSM 19469 TaxID=1294273 RepID=W8S117_9RHOB|nr:hypothetical protein roselon_01469 [Roseibacterium elongatum DSM 19469]
MPPFLGMGGRHESPQRPRRSRSRERTSEWQPCSVSSVRHGGD